MTEFVVETEVRQIITQIVNAETEDKAAWLAWANIKANNTRVHFIDDEVKTND